MVFLWQIGDFHLLVGLHIEAKESLDTCLIVEHHEDELPVRVSCWYGPVKYIWVWVGPVYQLRVQETPELAMGLEVEGDRVGRHEDQVLQGLLGLDL